MTRTDEAKSLQQRKTQHIEVAEKWPLRRGKNELLAHLKDEDITRKEAMTAKCYDCCGGYDEPVDCGVATCPLHPWMPYRDGGPKKHQRNLSDEARQAVAERLQRGKEAAVNSSSANALESTELDD